MSYIHAVGLRKIQSFSNSIQIVVEKVGISV